MALPRAPCQSISLLYVRACLRKALHLSQNNFTPIIPLHLKVVQTIKPKNDLKTKSEEKQCKAKKAKDIQPKDGLQDPFSSPPPPTMSFVKG